tara:strand:+ start:11194 stop:12015 length:822 start_codon:yes stop_codon:yes gene_type:complete
METGKANNRKTADFNIALAEQYHLAIQIGNKELSYCIINTTTKTVEYFNSYIIDNNITTALNSDDIIKTDFQSSSLAFLGSASTIVPNSIYTKNSAKQILELNIEKSEIIKEDKVNKIDACIIYTVTEDINEIVNTYFPKAKQKSQQSILLEQFSMLDNSNKSAYLFINDNIVNITVFNNHRLIFNNSFDFFTKEDLLYFTLFSFEQLKIETEIVTVKVYGSISEEDEKYKILHDYIRNITLGSRSNELKFTSEFDTIQEHQYFGLFCQVLCE